MFLLKALESFHRLYHLPHFAGENLMIRKVKTNSVISADQIKMIDHQFLLQFFMLNKFRHNPLLSQFVNFN